MCLQLDSNQTDVLVHLLIEYLCRVTRNGYGSKLNHELTQNQIFFSLESRVDLNQYLRIRLSRELILSQFPGKPLKSWVDLNQYLRIRLSLELILSRFSVKPLQSLDESIQLSEILLESWVDRKKFLEKTLESKAPKKGHTKWNRMGQAQKRHTKSNLMGQRPKHNGIIKSWVHSNQYSRFLWVVSQYESKFWKAFWMVSWFESKPWELFEPWVDLNRNYGKPFELGVDLNQISKNLSSLELIRINSSKPLWVMSWVGIKTFWSWVESNWTSLSRTHICV